MITNTLVKSRTDWRSTASYHPFHLCLKQLGTSNQWATPWWIIYPQILKGRNQFNQGTKLSKRVRQQTRTSWLVVLLEEHQWYQRKATKYLLLTLNGWTRRTKRRKKNITGTTNKSMSKNPIEMNQPFKRLSKMMNWVKVFNSLTQHAHQNNYNNKKRWVSERERTQHNIRTFDTFERFRSV